MKIERILLATDFSPWAQRAEAYACFAATTWRANLTVMSVLEFPPGMDPEYPVNQQYLAERMRKASERLAESKQWLGQRGIPVSTRIGTGLPSEEIIAAARAEESDLILVGTRGKSGLAHVLLGSTAERVIRTAPCPVLAVHMAPGDESDAHSGVSLEHILVPTDFSDCSLDALEYAALIAGRAKATVTLLHVLEPVSYGLDFTLIHAEEPRQKRDAMSRKLEGLSSALTAAGIPCTDLIRGGTPIDSILDEARRASADLIVMGTHGRRGLSHVLGGSVTEALLRRTSCPVLTVRSPKFHPGHHRLIPTSTVSVTNL